MIDLTPKQIDAVHIRMTATCTDLRISRFKGREVEVSFFQRQRLIETVAVQPGGKVRILP